MVLQEHVSLKPFNTFGIEAMARFFVEITNERELVELCQSGLLKDKKHLVLGGGSNILFTQDFDGVIIKNSIKGFSTRKTAGTVEVKAGSGMEWHDLVVTTLDNNINGLENLSLIPGTVGASPVQNIGAYGVELKDIFVSLRAIEMETGELKIFGKNDCNFGYRNSVFKAELKGKYFITEVTLGLHSSNKVNAEYGVLASILAKNGIVDPAPKEVSNAVISIRQSKLPDPVRIGNAGSFFKNPVIEDSTYKELQKEFKDIPGFYQPSNKVKIPAAWLIEQNGWKGKRVGNIGVNPKQPLVLVNYGGGTGDEIKNLSDAIQKSVFDRFDITLEPEVNIL